jgi:hypothetical protein
MSQERMERVATLLTLLVLSAAANASSPEGHQRLMAAAQRLEELKRRAGAVGPNRFRSTPAPGERPKRVGQRLEPN